MMCREVISSIKLEDISLKFESGKEVYQNYSLDVPLNQIVWLKGASGAGKSVLLKILAGTITATSGRYFINGENVNQMSFEEFLIYRLNIGYSFDFGGLINNRTLFGNLALPLEYHKFGDEQVIIDQVNRFMDLFNIRAHANERPSAVAGGIRKAVCVARALIHEPELLLLDDPTTGLRPEAKQSLLNYLISAKESKKVKHILIATEDHHFMKELNATELFIHPKNKVELAGAA